MSKLKYLKVPADPTKPMEVVELAGLDELRAGIGGGWLEGVTLPLSRQCPGARFYCDEEFQYKQQLGVNLRASLMAHAAGVLPAADSVIGGDVLLFDGVLPGGYDKPLSDRTKEWAEAIEAHLKKLGAM